MGLVIEMPTVWIYCVSNTLYLHIWSLVQHKLYTWRGSTYKNINWFKKVSFYRYPKYQVSFMQVNLKLLLNVDGIILICMKLHVPKFPLNIIIRYDKYSIYLWHLFAQQFISIYYFYSGTYENLNEAPDHTHMQKLKFRELDGFVV